MEKALLDASVVQVPGPLDASAQVCASNSNPTYCVL